MPRPRLRLLLLACCAVGCVVPALSATSPSKGNGLLVTTGGCGPPGNKFNRNNGGDDAAAAAAAAGDAAAGDAVLLRVAPWAGCGAQVTFGLGWSSVLPVTVESESVHSDTDNKSVMPAPVGDVTGDVSVGVVSYPGRAARSRAPRPAGAAAHAPQKQAGARRTPRYPFRTLVSLPSHLSGSRGLPPPSIPAEAPSSQRRRCAFSRAPCVPGMTAVALALSGDALLAARQLRAASALIAALPESELVSVWILSLDPRPVLVSDVRKLWLGGRKHIDMRLKKVQDALSQAGPHALT